MGETPIARAFGQHLKMLRESKALTLLQLGKRAGLNSKFIALIEQGKKNVTLVTLDGLRKGLGIPLPQLLTFRAAGPRSQTAVNGDLVNRLLASLDLKTRNDVVRLLQDVLRLTAPRSGQSTFKRS